MLVREFCHSEFNASTEDIVHFLQFDPSRKESFNTELRRAKFHQSKTQPTMSFGQWKFTEDEALHINSPIKLFGSELDTGVQLQYSF